MGTCGGMGRMRALGSAKVLMSCAGNHGEKGKRHTANQAKDDGRENRRFRVSRGFSWCDRQRQKDDRHAAI